MEAELSRPPAAEQRPDDAGGQVSAQPEVLGLRQPTCEPAGADPDQGEPDEFHGLHSLRVARQHPSLPTAAARWIRPRRPRVCTRPRVEDPGMTRRARKWLIAGAALLLLAAAGTAFCGWLLVRPHRTGVGPPPAAFATESVRFTTSDGLAL